MDAIAISQQPSVDDLLGKLQDEHDQISALRQGIHHGVPRPPLLVRLLLLISVLLIAGVAALIAVVGWRTTLLVDQIRIHRADQRAEEAALPIGDALLDPSQFSAAARRRPDALAPLFAAKAQVLLQKKRTAEALIAFAEARQHALAPLTAGAQVAEIEALLSLGRQAEARERLLQCDMDGWTPQERARMVRILPAIIDSPVSH
jgi:hypothetical protein